MTWPENKDAHGRKEYKGNFSDGEIAGDGKMVWWDGLEFDGNFEDGKPHGKGTMSMRDPKNGERKQQGNDWKYETTGSYVGHQNGEKKYGPGLHKGNGGSVTKLSYPGLHKWSYQGQFWDDKADGEGECRWANDQGQLIASYKGQWKDGKFDGQGKHELLDGTKYEGQWKDDKYHGLGELIWPPHNAENLDKYNGQWANGDISGMAGTLTCRDTTEHTGEWRYTRSVASFGKFRLGLHDGTRFVGYLDSLCKKPASSQ
ncbi:unnamed protein product [Amoebophrya sp. A120]|nr:unnamed protein product [Amoebophrya sp. A120]|eukprot:GSA120T00026345001.1